MMWLLWSQGLGLQLGNVQAFAFSWFPEIPTLFVLFIFKALQYSDL